MKTPGFISFQSHVHQKTALIDPGANTVVAKSSARDDGF
jgi:hypothetical protein